MGPPAGEEAGPRPEGGRAAAGGRAVRAGPGLGELPCPALSCLGGRGCSAVPRVQGSASFACFLWEEGAPPPPLEVIGSVGVSLRSPYRERRRERSLL